MHTEVPPDVGEDAALRGPLELLQVPPPQRERGGCASGRGGCRRGEGGGRRRFREASDAGPGPVSPGARLGAGGRAAASSWPATCARERDDAPLETASGQAMPTFALRASLACPGPTMRRIASSPPLSPLAPSPLFSLAPPRFCAIRLTVPDIVGRGRSALGHSFGSRTAVPDIVWVRAHVGSSSTADHKWMAYLMSQSPSVVYTPPPANLVP